MLPWTPDNIPQRITCRESFLDPKGVSSKVIARAAGVQPCLVNLDAPVLDTKNGYLFKTARGLLRKYKMPPLVFQANLGPGKRFRAVKAGGK